MKTANEILKETRDAGQLFDEGMANEVLKLIELDQITGEHALMLLKEACYGIIDFEQEECPDCEWHRQEINELENEVSFLQDQLWEFEDQITELKKELKEKT